jgi:hypothetical protein
MTIYLAIARFIYVFNISEIFRASGGDRKTKIKKEGIDSQSEIPEIARICKFYLE